MPDPSGGDVVMGQDAAEVYCYSCRAKMQQIGPTTFKCPKCGLVHDKKA